ncbi:MAG: hypothetical protein HOG49_08255 [Candidatus Scalindua sp.]|jgi:DNA repair exonuclease SbcCD nuclease subunit|nr:hypothetical protein [Candidatus Scalindua sp.]
MEKLNPVSEAIILGDSHFGKNKFSLDVYQDQMDFYQEQFFPYILSSGATTVISLGDLFDNRTVQDVNILLKVMKDFFYWFEQNRIDFYIIMGNHDSYFNNNLDVSTLFLFEHLNYIHIIKKDSLMNIGGVEWQLTPWIFKGGTFDLKSDYVMGHFEINGFKMSKSHTCSAGAEVDSFKNCKKVLSGHFHLKQEKGPILYVGTPYGLDWNDVNSEKGFYHLKGEEISFHENIISKQYIETKYYDGSYHIKDAIIEQSEIEELIEKHHVRIKTDDADLQIGEDSVSLIIDIEESSPDIAEDLDVETFIVDSLTKSGFKRFNQLEREIINNG